MKNKYITLLTALFAATLAHGDLAVSNLGETTDGDTLISENLFQATSFTTGNLDGGYKLSTIGFEYGAGGAEDNKVELFLYLSEFNVPGSIPLAARIAPGGAAGEIKYVDFSAHADLLDPSTEYFVVLRGSLNNENIAETSSSSDVQGDIPTVGDGWSIGNSRWTRAGVSGWSNIGENPLKIEVNVIPEPATLSLIALLGGGLLLTRRIFMV